MGMTIFSINPSEKQDRGKEVTEFGVEVVIPFQLPGSMSSEYRT